jgi:hypothetical protein
MARFMRMRRMCEAQIKTAAELAAMKKSLSRGAEWTTLVRFKTPL